MKKFRKRTRLGFLLLLIVMTGLLIPQHMTNPVAGADKNSYHPQSFCIIHGVSLWCIKVWIFLQKKVLPYNLLQAGW